MIKVELKKGDCLQKLKELEDNSVDSIVTDPPYMIGFMGKGWDSGDNNIVGKVELWKECLRVLKPGGHLLSFGATRTYHRMTTAIEDAGFEIRDCIFWCYGSGFPKSHNIGKAVDKLEGNEREVVGTKNDFSLDGVKRNPTKHREVGESNKEIGHEYGYKQGWDTPITKGTSQYEGWGTALKPAVEPIVMGRKPFKGNVAGNVLEWGTGGINIDGCRVGYVSEYDKKHQEDIRKGSGTFFGGNGESKCEQLDMEGRFPANLILDEEAGKVMDLQSGNKTGQRGVVKGTEPSHNKVNSIYGDYSMVDGKYAEPMDVLGGASRFFYCPKTSKKDRNEGMPEVVPQFTARPRREDGSVIYKETDGEEWTEVMKDKPRREKTSLAASEEILQPTTKGTMNTHPTVKPTDLMAYLIRLVTPKGGVVLDPFMGSGSTGKGAVREGMSFIGIEREDEYFEIAKSRIEHEQKKNKHTDFFDI